MASAQVNKKKILKYLGFYTICFIPYIIIIFWINSGGLKGYDLQYGASFIITILWLFGTKILIDKKFYPKD